MIVQCQNKRTLYATVLPQAAHAAQGPKVSPTSRFAEAQSIWLSSQKSPDYHILAIAVIQNLKSPGDIVVLPRSRLVPGASSSRPSGKR